MELNMPAVGILNSRCFFSLYVSPSKYIIIIVELMRVWTDWYFANFFSSSHSALIAALASRPFWNSDFCLIIVVNLSWEGYQTGIVTSTLEFLVKTTPRCQICHVKMTSVSRSIHHFYSYILSLCCIHLLAKTPAFQWHSCGSGSMQIIQIQVNNFS